MEKIISLLKDNNYLADLLNGPCKPEDDFKPINPEWIDDTLSDQVTEAYHRMLPDDLPFNSIVRAVKHPNSGLVIEDGSMRTRYIIVTVLKDIKYPFNKNFPIIHALGVVSLSTWEMARAVAAVNREGTEVRIVDTALRRFLNFANPEWVTLYLGEEEYAGITSMKDLCFTDDQIPDMNIHLIDVRKVGGELASRLIKASA